LEFPHLIDATASGVGGLNLLAGSVSDFLEDQDWNCGRQKPLKEGRAPGVDALHGLAEEP
jgi:hypothetical protein